MSKLGHTVYLKSGHQVELRWYFNFLLYFQRNILVHIIKRDFQSFSVYLHLVISQFWHGHKSFIFHRFHIHSSWAEKNMNEKRQTIKRATIIDSKTSSTNYTASIARIPRHLLASTGRKKVRVSVLRLPLSAARKGKTPGGALIDLCRDRSSVLGPWRGGRPSFQGRLYARESSALPGGFPVPFRKQPNR